MCRTKRFIIVAVLSALVLTFNSVGLACGARPAQAPTSPPPVSTEPESGPWTPQELPEQTPPPEPEIPANYTTYTDEAQLFSISYPSDWQTDLASMADAERHAKEVITSLKTGIPIENTRTIFLAGIPTGTGINPGVNIVIEPLPQGASTHDQMVEAEVRGAKMVISDYRELSRIKITVDGREATILDWEGTPQGQAKRHYLVMLTLVNKTTWVVTCAALPADFAKWEKDFDAIVRSLRVSTGTE